MLAQRARLETQGFAVLGPVLSAERAHQLQTAFHDHIGPSPEANAYGLLRNDVWRAIELFRQELYEGPLAELACALLGAECVVLFQDNVIEKPPHHGVPVEWHQDYAYWPLDRPDGVTLWVALSDADLSSGCLHYLPETHRWGERQATDFMPDTHQPQTQGLPTIEVRDHHRPVACPVRPGDVLAHHPLTWHMSHGNQTAHARCGWSLTFVARSTRWAPEHAPHPLNYLLQPTPGATLSDQRFPHFTRSAS